MSIRLPASAFQRTSAILPQSPPSYKPNLFRGGLKMAHLHIVQWDATNADKTGRKELRFFRQNGMTGNQDEGVARRKTCLLVRAKPGRAASPLAAGSWTEQWDAVGHADAMRPEAGGNRHPRISSAVLRHSFPRRAGTARPTLHMGNRMDFTGWGHGCVAAAPRRRRAEGTGKGRAEGGDVHGRRRGRKTGKTSMFFVISNVGAKGIGRGGAGGGGRVRPGGRR